MLRNFLLMKCCSIVFARQDQSSSVEKSRLIIFIKWWMRREIFFSKALIYLFHPVSNFNTLRHQFESGKTQKTAGRRLSVTIGNTKVTIAQIAITIIQV
jgi:hypothetical protein